MTTPETPLPKIGGAAAVAPRPVVGGGYFDAEWNRLAAVRVQGRGLTSDLTALVVSASMSYSSSQTGQLSLSFQDTEDGSLLRSQIFGEGVIIDFLNQHMEVRSIDVATGDGGPRITVAGRARVIGAMTGKGQSARGSWGTQVVEDWVRARCREAGARSVVQTGFGSLLFTRDNDNDSTWGMMQRAAQVVGAWCYEMENTIYFGRPTWLADKARARWWPIKWASASDYTPGLTGQPTYHWAADGDTTMGFGLISGDADIIRPGDGVTLSGGVVAANGDWIVTQVDMPLTSTEATGVACGRIRDPDPRPLVGGS